MVFLLAIVVLILLFGAVAVKNGAGIVLGIVGAIGLVAWIAVKSSLDPGLVMLIVFGGPVAALGLFAWLGNEYLAAKVASEQRKVMEEWAPKIREAEERARESQARAEEAKAVAAGHQELIRKCGSRSEE